MPITKVSGFRKPTCLKLLKIQFPGNTCKTGIMMSSCSWYTSTNAQNSFNSLYCWDRASLGNRDWLQTPNPLPQASQVLRLQTNTAMQGLDSSFFLFLTELGLNLRPPSCYLHTITELYLLPFVIFLFWGRQDLTKMPMQALNSRFSGLSPWRRYDYQPASPGLGVLILSMLLIEVLLVGNVVELRQSLAV